MKKLGLALVTLLLWAAVFAQTEIDKVGFIYVGPVGDAGWTYAHDFRSTSPLKQNWVLKPSLLKVYLKPM